MPPAGEGRQPSEAESEDAKRFFTLATQARQSEDFAAAIDLYTQGLEIARTVELRSALLLNRSLTRSSIQQWKIALADANECLSLRPSWSRSYECLAVCLQGLGREEESILSKRLAAGLAALKLNPKNENLKQQVRDIRKELAIAHDRGRAKNPQAQASTETVPVQAQVEAARPPEPGSTLQDDAPSPRAATAADGNSSGSISSRPTESQVATPFEPGCRVRVQGLIAARQYNGLLGTLRGTDGSRYVVHLDKGGELHVQAKHFTVVISSPATVPASKLPGDHATMDTSPLSMARDDPGPFRGHPPAGVSQASNVSTAWVAANKISAAGDTGKAGLHAVLACIRGQFIFENMGREGQLWRHGVRRNDRLLAVNDRQVDDMNLHDVHALIEGNEGSRLCLTLQRSDDQGGSPTPWKITLMRTSSYVIDCLVAVHQELLGILQYHNDVITSHDGEAMQYSSALVTDLHQRLIAGMQTLKRDQRQLLQDKAQMRCELEEYERRCNTSWADGRRADDENRRMYQELEEREKMMQMMASDFDDIMSDSRERFAAVTITLDQPFDTTFNTYSTVSGSVTFEEKFRLDLAQILRTDEDRVAVLGMSKGSVVLDTVLLPPQVGSTDARPAWQLKSALKAMVSDNMSVLYHSTNMTAKTVAVTDMPEAKVLQDAQARCVRLGHENAVLAHDRDMLVGENHQLGLKIDKLEKRSQELESTSREAQETIFVLRNEISVIRNQLSHDTSVNDREVRLRELTELVESREKQIADMNQSLSTRVAFLQKSEASERQRCTEAEARARDIEGELRRVNKTVAALEGQLAASNGIRETMESKYRKMDQTMQQLQDTDGDLRRQLRALQDENHHLERLSAQLRASAVSVSANSSADAELYKKEVSKLQRQMQEDMVPKPKHESMKAACTSELKEMAVKLEEYQQRVADVTTALALHAKVLVEGELSGEARAEMQAQV